MKKIRFGITGSGFMGRTHAEAVKRLAGDASLVALWGGSRAPALAQKYGVTHEPTMESLMRRTDIDAIVISTPHHRHAAEALAAIESGKHVLIEKPMATSVEDCDRILAAAKHQGVTVGIGYQQRFRMNNIRTRELLQSGAIGRLLSAQVSMPMYKPAATVAFGGTWEWWNDPQSVGHLINTAPHATDLMRWLTGASIANVSAFCRTFTPGLAVEDTTHAIMEFTNGTLFSLFSTNVLPVSGFPGEDFRFRLIGTKGLIELAPVGEMKMDNGSGWQVMSNQPFVIHNAAADTAFGDIRMQCYRDQMKAFIDGIHGQPLRCGSGTDGRTGVADCLAMFTSSREHRWVQP